MLIRLLASVACGALLSACATVEESSMPASPSSAAIPTATGYFAQPSTLPFHAPDFTKFVDADLQPAIEQGITITRVEIDVIANNPEPPT